MKSQTIIKNTVIYHSADFDGIFCREIANKFLPNAELIGWNYGDAKLPFPGEGLVYVLDLSPECFNLTTDNLPMREDGGFDGNLFRLIWIDHHKSGIDKFPVHISGYRIDGVAACRLAWQWFSQGRDGYALNVPSTKEPYTERRVMEPWAVRLAGEYDVWDKRDPHAELFQHGLRSRALDNQDWDLMFEECWDKEPGGNPITGRLLEGGKALQYARTKENESIIKQAGFTVQFEGLTFLACNNARYNSQLFEAGLKPEHDACLGFAWRGGQWAVSLYHAPGKEHHDLSLIASKHGGGGHRGVCGYNTKTLPFLS